MISYAPVRNIASESANLEGKFVKAMKIQYVSGYVTLVIRVR